MRSKADIFIDKFGTAPLSSKIGMAAIKWMHDNDPVGSGSLHDRCIMFTFTDHSQVKLDLRNQSFSKVTQ